MIAKDITGGADDRGTNILEIIIFIFKILLILLHFNIHYHVFCTPESKSKGLQIINAD